MKPKILIGNVNNSKLAQDNIIQLSIEKNAGITIITEPNKIPKSNKWIIAKGKVPRVAMLLGNLDGYFLPVMNIGSESGLIAVKWRSYVCIGIYQSPNSALDDFKNKLKWIRGIISEYKENPVLIAGDFNSRHKRWDLGKFNQRGTILEKWLVKHNLQILNPRFVVTCIHPRGTSAVDLVIGNRNLTSDLPVCNIGDIIVGSDHRWLTLGIPGQRERELQCEIEKSFPRWAYKKLDMDLFYAAMMAETWIGPTDNIGINNLVENIDYTLHRASNVAMPKKSGGGKRGKKQVYWWNDDIDKLRSEYLKTRRKYIKLRKKKR